MKIQFSPKANATKPQGWLQQQMANDLQHGFAGHLDQLLPHTIIEDDTYGSNRRGEHYKEKMQYLPPYYAAWWNSESQSQWRDGWIRQSFLLQDKPFIAKCHAYVEDMLAKADADGYMGIYDSVMRYHPKEKNTGELWSQTTLFRTLLGFYEMTGDERCLHAVIKAVNVTMMSYNEEQCHQKELNIFNFENTHGLMFADILGYLFDFTKDKKYIHYMEWLYDQFSNASDASECDAKKQNIADSDYDLLGHGVHTYEHLRVLVWLAYTTENPDYRKLLDQYLLKISRCICPSGAPIGDEQINGFHASSTHKGYEYCCLQELLHGYSLLLEKSNDVSFADKIEKLFLNAAQGARHPEESSIAYLRKDNAYSMTNLYQYERRVADCQKYTYSPTHEDEAVCCVPNAVRIPAYYLQAAWHHTDSGLFKALYGASVFHTTIGGTEIHIREKSNFPADGNLSFDISFSKPTMLTIAFRIPAWCKKYTVKSDKQYQIIGNLIVFEDRWETENSVDITFEYTFTQHYDLDGETYFMYGPLVLAMPLKAKRKIGKEYDVYNLRDLYYALDETIPKDLQADDDTLHSFRLVAKQSDWRDLSFEAVLYHDFDCEKKTVRFVPMGNTILRQITFIERDV